VKGKIGIHQLSRLAAIPMKTTSNPFEEAVMDSLMYRPFKMKRV